MNDIPQAIERLATATIHLYNSVPKSLRAQCREAQEELGRIEAEIAACEQDARKEVGDAERALMSSEGLDEGWDALKTSPFVESATRRSGYVRVTYSATALDVLLTTDPKKYGYLAAHRSEANVSGSRRIQLHPVDTLIRLLGR